MIMAFAKRHRSALSVDGRGRGLALGLVDPLGDVVLFLLVLARREVGASRSTSSPPRRRASRRALTGLSARVTR